MRIIRAVRFAAKLGFEIEAKTRAPIGEMAALLDNVPQSRLFDEMIKLLQTGHALASIDELRKHGPGTRRVPGARRRAGRGAAHDRASQFVQAALADTDRRVGEDKPVAPSFLLACVLWHDVRDGWPAAAAGRRARRSRRCRQAIDAVFDARIGDISGPRQAGAPTCARSG